jgi:hypothetical protein
MLHSSLALLAFLERAPGPARPMRLYRNLSNGANHDSFFPGPNGAPMSRAALHNALRPCACNRLRRKRTSPLRCCRRLILRLSYPARMGCCFCTRSDGRKTQANTRPFGNRGQTPALDRPKIGGLNAVRTDLNCQSRPRLEQSDDWQRPHHRACHDPMRPPTRPA